MEDTTHLHIEFFSDAVENRNKSAKEGRPIYEDREFVRIRYVGDPKNVLVAPAGSQSVFDPERGRYLTYAERFPRHYQAFKDGQTFFGGGTPLKEVPFLTEAKRKELAALNVHTLEALAELEGASLARLGMGGRELKNKAIAMIGKASGSAEITRIAGENAVLKDRLEAMQRQMDEMMAGREPAAPVAEDGGPEQNPASPFAEWAPDDIKAFIADRTGSRPKGNPSHATLVATADGIIAKEAEQKAA